MKLNISVIYLVLIQNLHFIIFDFLNHLYYDRHSSYIIYSSGSFKSCAIYATLKEYDHIDDGFRLVDGRWKNNMPCHSTESNNQT